MASSARRKGRPSALRMASNFRQSAMTRASVVGSPSMVRTWFSRCGSWLWNQSSRGSARFSWKAWSRLRSTKPCQRRFRFSNEAAWLDWPKAISAVGSSVTLTNSLCPCGTAHLDPASAISRCAIEKRRVNWTAGIRGKRSDNAGAPYRRREGFAHQHPDGGEVKAGSGNGDSVKGHVAAPPDQALAPVDGQVLAGQAGRLEDEAHGAGHIVQRRAAPQRRIAPRRFILGLGLLAAAQDQAGRDAAQPAAGRQPHGQGLRQSRQTHLARRIGEEVRVRTIDLVIQNIDHHPLPVRRLDGPGEVADQEDRRRQVRRQMLGPRRLGQGRQGIIAKQGGVVDQGVDPPEMADDTVDQAVALARLIEVRRKGRSPHAEAAQVGDQSRRLIRPAAMVDSHVPARLGQGPRQTCADAPRGPGDQHHLVQGIAHSARPAAEDFHARARGFREDVRLGDPHPTGLDRRQGEADADQLLDQGFQQLDMVAATPACDMISHPVIVDEARPRLGQRPGGEHLDIDDQPRGALGVPLPRVQADAHIDRHIRQQDADMVPGVTPVEPARAGSGFSQPGRTRRSSRRR
uniref:LigA n=1 Tax=Parastrongyloides trichosuri TaxID=131310 RepID=A0A0N5A6X6_PARTI